MSKGCYWFNGFAVVDCIPEDGCSFLSYFWFFSPSFFFSSSLYNCSAFSSRMIWPSLYKLSDRSSLGVFPWNPQFYLAFITSSFIRIWGKFTTSMASFSIFETASASIWLISSSFSSSSPSCKSGPGALSWSILGLIYYLDYSFSMISCSLALLKFFMSSSERPNIVSVLRSKHEPLKNSELSIGKPSLSCMTDAISIRSTFCWIDSLEPSLLKDFISISGKTYKLSH